MTFSEKLKKLRKDNNLTQDELAEKIYVTRTAISKWETDKGFPDIDNLKLISNLFGITIDDLISDSDIESKRILDEKRARKMYYVAIAFVALATLCSLLAYFLKLPYLNIAATLAAVGYTVFAFLSKPKYKRLSAKKILLPYIISRLVVLLVVIVIIVTTIIQLG